MHQEIVTNNTTDSQSHAKRVIKKTRSQRIGYVSFDGQTSSVACAVHDFDEFGAVLTMNGWMGVPEEFPLFIEPDRVQVVCKVMKKRGSKVQVNFKSWEEGARRKI